MMTFRWRVLHISFILCLILGNAALSCAGKSLILGVHPFQSFPILKEQFTPLTEYLSKKLNKTVTLRVGLSYEEHIRAIGENHIDIAYIGPAGYVQMVEQYGQQNTLVVQEVKESIFFKGVIFTQTGSPYQSLSEISSGDFAFVDPHSTMGFVLPAFVLLQENPEILQQQHYRFAKTHENVALGVLAGTFIAGATKESVYATYKDKGLKALKMTPEVAEHLFVCRKDFSSHEVAEIQKAFTDLNSHPNGVEIMHAIKPTITRFVPVKDSAYDSLRSILSQLRKKGIIE